MNRLVLPALSAGELTGFLAALGTARLCTVHLRRSVRVGWPDGYRNPAVLEGDLPVTIDELAVELEGLASACVTAKELLPGVGSGFPPLKQGKESDPTRRLTVTAARGLSMTADRLDEEGATEMSEWVLAMFATNNAKELVETLETSAGEKALKIRSLIADRSRLFDGGPGTVSMSKTLTDARNAAATPGAIHHALVDWRRTEKQTGAYLDWRADRDATTLAQPNANPLYGEPAATWLALMALPFLPSVASSSGVATVPGWARRKLSWPVWRAPLDLDAIRILLSHPSVAPPFESLPKPRVQDLRALGVDAILQSERTRKGNNDGAFSAARLVWPV